MSGSLLPEDGDAQIPNLVIQRHKRRLRKVPRRGKIGFETCHAKESPFELLARQILQAGKRFGDGRNPMTNHSQIIPGADRSSNRFFEAVFIQDRSHVEVVRHDEPVEAELAAEQFGDDAVGE